MGKKPTSSVGLKKSKIFRKKSNGMFFRKIIKKFKDFKVEEREKQLNSGVKTGRRDINIENILEKKKRIKN